MVVTWSDDDDEFDNYHPTGGLHASSHGSTRALSGLPSPATVLRAQWAAALGGKQSHLNPPSFAAAAAPGDALGLGMDTGMGMSIGMGMGMRGYSSDDDEFLEALEALDPTVPPPGVPDEEFDDVLALLYSELEAELGHPVAGAVSGDTGEVFDLLDEVEHVEREAALAALSTERSVICPVCCAASLGLARGVLFCQCGLRVNLARLPGIVLTLDQIHDMISAVATEHAAQCAAPPAFDLSRGPDGAQSVILSCPRCSHYAVVI
ncbi:uncharacterized protein AMSG_00919 [Thecamonas trahens ATCC 50062]|uniref:RPA-interacting protein C-terminal domain-containing protein n=1 Tax=Thecamonas trahens ATCC 50062 TaxID=461836 RepID=A0A0L0DJ46_THETB|nr:hypothetical protein AMSG_00919 [Thecamonas trahens ATCC 50062]KNC52091.1 hypothetical protein AMSG_00919 [Thecamonas trahens ATCC 50062]|eukprot:XP_013762096.1 hypothetical protein AMSG_00919 [Thecamonas trahens ATCC 50062]